MNIHRFGPFEVKIERELTLLVFDAVRSAAMNSTTLPQFSDKLAFLVPREREPNRFRQYRGAEHVAIYYEGARVGSRRPRGVQRYATIRLAP